MDGDEQRDRWEAEHWGEDFGTFVNDVGSPGRVSNMIYIIHFSILKSYSDGCWRTDLIR